jgi:hypothetical protein
MDGTSNQISWERQANRKKEMMSTAGATALVETRSPVVRG